MSFTALLIQRAEVYRRSGDVDAFGQAVDSNPGIAAQGDPDSTFACRIDRGSGGRTNQERSIDVFEIEYTVFAEPDADVREDDAIRILDADGTVLVPAARVKIKNSVGGSTHTHHLELKLAVQRGPQ